MSRKFPISEGAIRSHKCCLCSHLLSVPPIMTTGLEEELYKCGRCENVKCQTYIRIHLFEDVAQHLSFPCSYNNCKKNIPWGKVEKHEKNCPHRTIKCPIYYHNCSEMIPVANLLNHFRDKHKDNIKTIGTSWELNTKYDYVFLIKKDDQYFLVYILHLEERFSIAVLALEPSKYTKFNAKILSTTEDNIAVYFKDLPICRYDERLHCYMCMRKKCKELYHPFSNRNQNDDMDWGNFTNKLKKELIESVKTPDGSLRYCITLQADESFPEYSEQSMKEDCEDEEEASGTNSNAGDNNGEAVRQALTCPYCMMYMAAPIFTCPFGHTICNVCRPRLKRCPTCAETFGKSRNYTLEEMVRHVKVPCQYDSKGCTFTANTTKMYIHEQECSFNNLLRE